jgi:hypothetical protein
MYTLTRQDIRDCELQCFLEEIETILVFDQDNIHLVDQRATEDLIKLTTQNFTLLLELRSEVDINYGSALLLEFLEKNKDESADWIA